MIRKPAQTSIYSYIDIKGNSRELGKTQRKVFDAIRTHGNIHNRYIHELTGLEIGNICGRTAELEELGFIRKSFQIRDKKTHKLCDTWVQHKTDEEVKGYFQRLEHTPVQYQLWGSL